MPDLLQPGINALGKYMKTKIATFIGLFSPCICIIFDVC